MSNELTQSEQREINDIFEDELSLEGKRLDAFNLLAERIFTSAISIEKYKIWKRHIKNAYIHERRLLRAKRVRIASKYERRTGFDFIY